MTWAGAALARSPWPWPSPSPLGFRDRGPRLPLVADALRPRKLELQHRLGNNADGTWASWGALPSNGKMRCDEMWDGRRRTRMEEKGEEEEKEEEQEEQEKDGERAEARREGAGAVRGGWREEEG